MLPRNQCEPLFSPSAQVLPSQRPSQNLLRHRKSCGVFLMDGLMGLPSMKVSFYFEILHLTFIDYAVAYRLQFTVPDI